MPTVEFARSLTRHKACPVQHVAADTLRESLDEAFCAVPELRAYVLDDQGAVRKHVAVFVNARQIASRADLDISLQHEDKVMVIQALTGG